MIKVELDSKAKNTVSKTLGLNEGGEVVDNGEKIEDLVNKKVITKASATEVGGNIYIFGGRNNHNVSNRIEKYNCETGVFTTLETILPYNLFMLQTASCGNKIYIFGGRKKVGSSDSANEQMWCFDTVTENLTTLEKTGYYSSAVTVGGYIYLFYQNIGYSVNIYSIHIISFYKKFTLKKTIISLLKL